MEKPGKKNCCFSLLWCVKIDFDNFRIWCCVCATINVNEYIYNVYCRCWWMVWDGWVLCKLLILWYTSRLLHTCYMLQSQCNIWYKLFCKKKYLQCKFYFLVHFWETIHFWETKIWYETLNRQTDKTFLLTSNFYLFWTIYFLLKLFVFIDSQQPVVSTSIT